MYGNRFGILSLVLCALIALAGCDTEEGALSTRPDSAGNAMQQGLTLTNADAENGLCGTFVEGDRSFSFETVRAPGVVYNDRGDVIQDFEVAVRILDAKGRTVSVFGQGHSAPESWLELDDASLTDSPGKDLLLTMPEGAHMVVEAMDVPQALELERKLVADAVRSLVADLSDPELARLRVEDDAEGGLSAEAWGQYKQKIWSYWKPAFFNGSPFHHTGTKTRRYKRVWGGWNYVCSWTWSNHGTSPNSSSMTYYAYHCGPSTYFPIPPATCASLFGINHVCNNDTLLQQMNVKHNVPYIPFACCFPCNLPLLWRPYL